MRCGSRGLFNEVSHTSTNSIHLITSGLLNEVWLTRLITSGLFNEVSLTLTNNIHLISGGLLNEVWLTWFIQ